MAAVFSNSILGLLTNRESALSALASSITGKSPYSNLLMDKFRHAKVTVKPDYELATELDYGLLGYFAGNTVSDNCIGINAGEEKLDTIKAKALSAAIGTSRLLRNVHQRRGHETRNYLVWQGRSNHNKR